MTATTAREGAGVPGGNQFLFSTNDDKMKSSARFWLIYCLAWLPYAASYLAVFTYQDRVDNFARLFALTLFNVVPAALLGAAVVWLCGRIDWAQSRKTWFFPAQIGFAVAYSLGWYGLVLLVLSVELSLRRGAWSPFWFSGYALQWQLFSGVMIYATIASVVYAAQNAANLRHEIELRAAAETRAARVETLYAQAELAALRAQLNPHFLFNTLHSLMALVRYEPQAAEDALEKLAEMLRYVLRERRGQIENVNLVSLADEWRFVENYLALEKLRLGERLTVENRIEPGALDCLLPALTLQPLVENSIKHGIAPRARCGTVTIAARRSGAVLELTVTDDGAGATADEMRETGGLGLRLVEQQLKIHYGDGATFDIETAPGDGFAVRIELPAQSGATLHRETQKQENQSVNR